MRTVARTETAVATLSDRPRQPSEMIEPSIVSPEHTSIKTKVWHQQIGAHFALQHALAPIADVLEDQQAKFFDCSIRLTHSKWAWNKDVRNGFDIRQPNTAV
jgi:hypothetical protein